MKVRLAQPSASGSNHEALIMLQVKMAPGLESLAWQRQLPTTITNAHLTTIKTQPINTRQDHTSINEASMKHQGSTKETPRKHQGNTKETPRKHQGNTRYKASQQCGACTTLLAGLTLECEAPQRE
jgi:hypothetical protein